MAFLLLEITSRDAYERFYKSIPEDEYYTIIQAVQGKDNDEFLEIGEKALALFGSIFNVFLCHGDVPSFSENMDLIVKL